MTPFRNRLKTPEEIELEHKYQKLATSKSELKKYENDYNNLKSEIRMFEQVYEDILGSRIEALEDLEWQLQGLLGNDQAHRSESESGPEPVYSHFQHITDLLDDDNNSSSDTADLSLKSLYRGVAKAVHPDLASDESDRQRRQELMALANEAYQTGNRQVLSDLLNEWEQTPVFNTDLDIAMELIRVIRQISLVEQNIHAMIRQIEELKQADIYIFKLRVDESLAEGIDLLAEMSARVDMDIARVRWRLKVLRAESGDCGDCGDFSDGSPETRIIRFPSDKSCGTLYIRNITSLDYRDWQQTGAARGAREIFLDKSLRLDVRGSEINDLRFLADLQPDDLQSLFLYNVDDTALPYLTHMTGLQELYVSDAGITDHGLTMLRTLKGLQRLSIYHTSISDRGLFNLSMITGLKWLTCSGTTITEEGLNTFRRVMPGCKAVSFKWRYEGQGNT